MLTCLFYETLKDVAERCLFKAIDKQLIEASLSSLRLRRLPNLANLAPDLINLTSLNLSKNNMFDGDEVFQVDLYSCIHACKLHLKWLSTCRR